VLEAMKMQRAVLAPGDGVVAEIRAKEGEQATAGQVPAMLEAAVTETSDAS
jgi:biotin carboxyl carrier protein